MKQITNTRNVILPILFVFFSLIGFGQIAISDTPQNPDASAQLDVISTEKGFLPPRMTQAERNVIPFPATGLLIYCTDCRLGGEIQYYNGFTWSKLMGERVPFYQLGNDIDGEAAGDVSGSFVSLSNDGNVVAIGAHENDGNGNNAGHIRVYTWTGVSWSQLGNDIDGEAADDLFGWSVSLSSDGTQVAIGARRNDGNGNNSGHVRVYEWNGSAWIQLGNDIDGEAGADEFGWSVSLSSNGSRIIIGAPENDGNGTSAGHSRVYEWNGSSWIQLGNDIDGEAAGDFSGRSVSMSSDGNIIAIGAPQNDGSNNNAGQARVYEWNGSAWIQLGNDIDGEASFDLSGWSIDLSSDGNRIAIGARNNNGNTGHVRIYEWNGSAWIQLGNDIDGEVEGDVSGSAVSLSDGGNIVAIGAYANDGNGLNAGHVRIYEWNGISWNQLESDIDGEAEGDESGWSVSISADGARVAIGGRLNDGNGNNSGHVRIFN